MRFFRKERVGSLIQEELSKLLLREVEVPGALISITEVDVTKKLDHAKVMVSVLPSEKAEVTMKQLTARAGHFQHELNHVMNIRPMPRIEFRLDIGLEKAAAIERALLKEENKG